MIMLEHGLDYMICMKTEVIGNGPMDHHLITESTIHYIHGQNYINLVQIEQTTVVCKLNHQKIIHGIMNYAH